MKKLKVAFITLLLLGSIDVLAFDPIGLGVGFEGSPIGSGHSKVPVVPPSLWQEGHQILFEANHSDYTLDIVQDGEVVYSTFVPSSTTLVTLPVFLSGESEILLYSSSAYYFYGYIIL